jgi:hypothetical protein
MHRIEEEILNYLRNNPGSSKADIIRNMRDKHLASRMTVLEYIKDLENENMIYERKERPDSQSYMIYINEDNELASVLLTLEDFKKAFIDLLEKSKERINNKDYSEAAKQLKLKEKDPVRWEDNDKAQFFRKEREKFIENIKTYSEFETWYDRSVNTNKITSVRQAEKKVQELEEKLRSESDSKQKNQTMLEINRYLSNLEADVVEALDLFLDNNIRTLYNVKNYEVEFLLNYAVFIYYWFIQIMTLYAVFMWPENIKDKQTLSNIYSIIFRTISEMQLQLLNLYSNNKIGYDTRSAIAMIAYYMKMIRDENLKPNWLYQYYALDMKSEINSVANSLLKLNEKIKNFNLVDIENFESIDFADKILEMEKWRKTFRWWIEKSKKISKIEINSPEFQHQSEMARHAFKKLVQLISV